MAGRGQMAGREGEATEVELVGFERPEGGGKTLYISGIPTSLSREEKWAALLSEFSRHGLVYDVSLPLSPANQEPISETAATGPHRETEYGFVTFYSRLEAKTASQASQRSPISLGTHELRVELARPRNKPRPPTTPTRSQLFHGQCQEVCNHFLGFSGWSLRILSVENIERDRESVWEGVRCCVEVRVGGCDGECARGVGEWRGEEGTEMREKLRTRAMARKIAFSRACETAFSNILIVLLPGKPAAAVVVERAEERVKKMMGELVSSCPPVTLLPCQPDDNSSQECPW